MLGLHADNMQAKATAVRGRQALAHFLRDPRAELNGAGIEGLLGILDRVLQVVSVLGWGGLTGTAPAAPSAAQAASGSDR